MLYCDNPKSRIFQEGDLEVFAALSNYAAVAIEQGNRAAKSYAFKVHAIWP